MTKNYERISTNAQHGVLCKLGMTSKHQPIANRLTYDPPSFTRFFKKFAGQTPSQFRNSETKTKANLISESTFAIHI